MSISGNAAGAFGGAFCMDGGRLNISGAVCATNNTAGKAGSFAVVRSGAVLNVDGSAVVNVGENRSGDESIVLVDRSSVTCGLSSPSWANGAYFVQGPLCACSAAFEAGASNTCDICGSRGWDARKCDCAVGADCECSHSHCM